MNFDAPSASPSAAGGTYLTPSASHGFNATPNSASGPPPASHKSLAQFIADLQRNIRDAFEPAQAPQNATQQQPAPQSEYDATLLHPLAVPTGSQSSTPAGSALQLPWPLITSALGSFEYQILNTGLAGQNIGAANQLVSPASNVSDKDRIRLLALMRETGALTLADLATEEGVQRSKKVIERRKDYKVGFPGNFAGKLTVKEVLESIAKDAGWETFQGADDAGGSGDPSGMDTDDLQGGNSGSISHTITMAGKGVVLDVDFELPASKSATPGQNGITASSKHAFGTITAVRFSYGLEGSTDPGVDKLLSKQAKAADWAAMRESILILARLDDVTGLQESMSRDEEAVGGTNADENASNGDPDPLSAMKALSVKLEEVFKSELEVVSTAASLFTMGHGLSTSYYSRPYTELIYHVQPYVLQTEQWDETVQSGFQNEEMAALLQLDEGVLSMSFKVQKSDKQFPFDLSHTAGPANDSRAPVSAFSLLPSPPAGLTEKIANGLQFVAKLNKPLIISTAAGRKLQDVLHGTESAAMFTFTSQSQMYQTSGQQSIGYLSQPVGPATLESLLLPGVAVETFYQLDMRNIRDCPPVRARLQALSNTPAFKLNHFVFETVDQLYAVTEILRTQACCNDILRETFDNSTALGNHVDLEASITLDSLLSDGPLRAIDVAVNVDADTSWPPYLDLSFLLPHLPSWLPVSADVRMRPSSQSVAGCQVLCSFTCNRPIDKTLSVSGPIQGNIEDTVFGHVTGDGKEAAETLENVLAISGDPKKIIEWIGSKVEKVAGSLKSMYS